MEIAITLKLNPPAKRTSNPDLTIIFHANLRNCLLHKEMKIVRNSCPVCKAENISFALKAIDHTVSHEEFEIWQCSDCTLRFTQSVPGENEIGAYYRSENYISHSDIDKGIINSLYHKVRKRTLVSKRKLIEAYVSKGKILDVGCGTGAFLHTMQMAGWQITGLEPDETARIKASQLYNLRIEEPARLYDLHGQAFDAITLWHVLEHVHDLDNHIDRVGELLKPDGRLFIAVPNYTSYDQTVYKNFWAAYDVPRHLYHFSPKSMKRLLQRHKLKLMSIKPMWYDSFYVSMLSEKNKTGKNNLIKSCFVGLMSNYKALWNKERCSSIIYVVGR